MFALLPALALSFAVAGEAAAQGAPQTISSVRVDVQKLATGYRSSKIVGSPVMNDNNEKIGTVDDLIVSRDDRVLFSVLSVGGFLGLGTHLVAVPYTTLQIGDRGIVLPGATKEALKAMPEFKYATRSAQR
jgi:sporulation protein YlmC with PRC-barrel domain